MVAETVWLTLLMSKMVHLELAMFPERGEKAGSLGQNESVYHKEIRCIDY